MLIRLQTKVTYLPMQVGQLGLLGRSGSLVEEYLYINYLYTSTDSSSNATNCPFWHDSKLMKHIKFCQSTPAPTLSNTLLDGMNKRLGYAGFDMRLISLRQIYLGNIYLDNQYIRCGSRP